MIICSTFEASFEHFVAFKLALTNCKASVFSLQMVGEQSSLGLPLVPSSDVSELKVEELFETIDVTAS
jgi:hypothetical protein